MGEGGGGGGGGGGEVGNRKVTVEICNARNLMPKDGQGTASAYVLVDFDGQRRRTTTKFRDLNPKWDEKLEFLVDDPESMASETLEVTVYNDKKTGKRTTFLGKVKISGGSFVKRSAEEDVALVYYPLEKRSVFSQIKGEIGLRVWYVDEIPKVEEAEKKEVVAEEKNNNNKSEGEKKEGEEKKGEEEKNEPSKSEETTSKNNKKKEENPQKNSEDKGKAEEDKQKKPEKPKKETKEKANVMKEDETTSVVEPPPQPPVLTVSSPSKVISSFAASRTGDLDIRSQLGERTGNPHDLVEKIQYLFVRVLKAKRSSDSDQSIYAKVSIGTHSVRTRVLQNGSEWDQVFAFHKGSLNSTALDISVWAEKKKNNKKKDTTTTDDATVETEMIVADSCLGVVSFDLQEIPKRLPPDSPLAPQWYTLEGENSSNDGGGGEDLMLATWLGTQVDEAFQGAWQSDSGGYNAHTRSKAYLSPKLWYLRVTIIQTQDLRFQAVAPSANRELSIKGQLGPQIFKTSKPVSSATSNSGSTAWNEDLVFVAAEPFDPFLLVTVEDSGKPVGHAKVHVSTIHRRIDDRSEPPPRWLNLATNDADRPYAGRIHIRVCLEGGYHVLDEAANITSDVRAASKQLSKPPIGILDVGIRCASNLLPIKPAGTNDGSTGGSTDAYVVLKYGPKWARTRTIVDHFNPRWDEQYSWDVFDPCTVLTVGVFDNGRHVGKQDIRVGKVRIRLSTLDTNRVYLNTYPLMLIHPTAGTKKMGEIELAVRFTCPSWINLMQSYTSPLLPRMHYLRPLGPAQQDLLRHAAMRIVSSRLARSEPPLGPEVVQFMLDTEANAWSMRKSKANWFRVVGCLSFTVGVAKWINAVRTWQNPTVTILVHMLLAAIVFCPSLLLPTIFMYLFLILMWRYRLRQRVPAVSMDPRLSCVDLVSPDELSEEFDTYPSGRSVEEVKARYDRLRALAGRAQMLLGDMASQGERVEGLMCWRDPRATAIFAVFCLVSAMVFYVVPLPIMSLVVGMYYLRHPRFRDDMPPPLMNFFRRLPSLADRLT